MVEFEARQRLRALAKARGIAIETAWIELVEAWAGQVEPPVGPASRSDIEMAWKLTDRVVCRMRSETLRLRLPPMVILAEMLEAWARQPHLPSPQGLRSLSEIEVAHLTGAKPEAPEEQLASVIRFAKFRKLREPQRCFCGSQSAARCKSCGRNLCPAHRILKRSGPRRRASFCRLDCTALGTIASRSASTDVDEVETAPGLPTCQKPEES